MTPLDYVYYDETSPTLLRWAHSAKGSIVKDQPAGSQRDRESYASVRFGGKTFRRSRVIWQIHNGEIPKGMFVDHINGDPRDDRIANLRLATPQENAQNRNTSRANRSGHPGVHFQARNKVWIGSISVDSKNTYLGSFKTKEEAVEVVRKARQEHMGNWRRGLAGAWQPGVAAYLPLC